jgi:hypothetical protein
MQWRHRRSSSWVIFPGYLKRRRISPKTMMQLSRLACLRGAHPFIPVGPRSSTRTPERIGALAGPGPDCDIRSTSGTRLASLHGWMSRCWLAVGLSARCGSPTRSTALPSRGSRSVHAVLRHLEASGFAGAPGCSGSTSRAGRNSATWTARRLAGNGPGRPGSAPSPRFTRSVAGCGDCTTPPRRSSRPTTPCGASARRGGRDW